ncbi:hypothetical protein [Agromyces allii]|uniref:Uncharacterized protein n=1 Tax=Agromyces allii TaxID=393607 RepID=A0ABP5C1P3_9MICO|nr:hypothetical protein [Agromyces allii]
MTGRRILIIVIATIALAVGVAGVAGTVAPSGRPPLASDTSGSTGALGTTTTPERPDDAGEATTPPDDAADDPGRGPLVETEATPPPPVVPPAEPVAELGGRVDGFPELIPLADGSRIVSSAVTADGDRVQATLEAESPATPREVLAGYVDAFTALAFAPVESPSVGGSTAITFTNGVDTVLVTVSDSVTGGTDYSVIGIFTAGKEG